MSRNDRSNQDRYDVIQAKEEFDSMNDPRIPVLQARIAELEAEVEELKQYKWMYEELQ